MSVKRSPGRKTDNMLFLPYQVRWLEDTSPVKIWEKSRRIGATFAQSYEDVSDVLCGRVPAVWFSSADESAAREYIGYCRLWVKMFLQARAGDEYVLQENKQPTQLQIVFANGGRITALSSNPKSFRSKGGKVVLDEFAHHEDDLELWKAAKPAVTWGFPLRILSTHNGKQTLFYKFIEEIRAGSRNWGLHSTDIFTAVSDGLVNKIMQRAASAGEQNNWLEELRLSCADDVVWREEFCCEPVDSSTALLPYELITPCIDDTVNPCATPEDLSRCTTPLVLGVDLGRKHDNTVFYGIAREGSRYRTAYLQVLSNVSFPVQKKILLSLLQQSLVTKCIIDATGPGLAFAEDIIAECGKQRVEACSFTQQNKEDMAYLVKCWFEEQKIILPRNQELLQDLHSIRRIISSSGNTVFEAARGTGVGHGDRFWALAMALQAARGFSEGSKFASGGRKKSAQVLQRYR